jgi:two-component system sensor histidine kinase/response regulator
MAKHLNLVYVYADAEPAVALGSAEITPANLAGLPNSWIESLRQAATRGRAGEILALSEQLNEDHRQLANTLREMVGNYEFKPIIELLERYVSNYLK